MTDPATLEVGGVNNVNRLCCAIVFRMKDKTLRQASGIPVRLLGPRSLVGGPRQFWTILVPAHVLVDDTPVDIGVKPLWAPGITANVEEFAICAANQDMKICMIWRVSSPEKVQKGTHFAICPEYKPNAPHRKEANWVALWVDPRWHSKAQKLANGQNVTSILGGAGGVFTFPVLDPGARWRLESLCRIMGFPEASLDGADALQQWGRLMALDDDCPLKGRMLMEFRAKAFSDWENANKAVKDAGVPLGLPMGERQFEPEDPSKRMWPLRMLHRGLRLLILNPLKGAGCKPAFEHRREVYVGRDLLVAEGNGNVLDPPGKGWVGGPWLQLVPRRAPNPRNARRHEVFSSPSAVLRLQR